VRLTLRLGKTKVMPQPLKFLTWQTLKIEASLARNLNLPFYTFVFYTHNVINNRQPKDVRSTAFGCPNERERMLLIALLCET